MSTMRRLRRDVIKAQINKMNGSGANKAVSEAYRDIMTGNVKHYPTNNRSPLKDQTGAHKG